MKKDADVSEVCERRGRRPYKRNEIAAAIRLLITEHALQPGDRLMGQNDLAAHLGVTVMTVFRALHDLGAEGVLHRVNGKGTFVGRPGQVARAREVCLVLPQAHLDDPHANPDFWAHVQTMQRAFVAACGSTRVFSIRVIPPEMPHAVAAAGLSGYEAAFFHYASRPKAFIRHLVNNRIVPAVAFGLAERDLACMTVDHDVVEGVGRGMRHLADAGYRRIAFVGSKEKWSVYSFEGYVRALERLGLARDPRLDVRMANLSCAEGAAAAQELCGRKAPFDAVLCAADVYAIGVVDHLRRRGVRIPEEVGVMGYGGTDAYVDHDPRLATVVIPYQREIELALAELAKVGGGRRQLRRQFMVVGEVHDGATVRRRAP